MNQCERNIALLIRIAWLGAIVAVSFCGAPGFAATISRSPDTEAVLVTIWSMIGLSSAAGNWLAPFNLRAPHQFNALASRAAGNAT